MQERERYACLTEMPSLKLPFACQQVKDWTSQHIYLKGFCLRREEETYDAAGDKEVASSSASAFVKMPQTSSVPAASTQKQKLPAKLAAAAKSAAAQRKRSPRVTSPKEAAPRQADPAPQASVSGQPQEPPLASKSAARGSVLQPAKKPAGKAVGQRPLTKPKSPKLGVSTRRQLVAGLSGSSVARQLDQANQTPSLTTPTHSLPECAEYKKNTQCVSLGGRQRAE
jgi:hypothetical protein